MADRQSHCSEMETSRASGTSPTDRPPRRRSLPPAPAANDAMHCSAVYLLALGDTTNCVGHVPAEALALSCRWGLAATERADHDFLEMDLPARRGLKAHFSNESPICPNGDFTAFSRP